MSQSCFLDSRSGRLEGRVEDGLYVLRGVPFASPPLGELRWSPPVPELPWTGVRDATRFGPGAPQRPGVLMRLIGAAEMDRDEDCLSLNVWTPGVDGARRPVMVWIHGGGFTTGAGSLPVFDGATLARRGDVVVVTVNYRLGALGFLAWSSLREGFEWGANFGLLDQIAALEWVREHADRLGGDPENVTLFGESAGAMSIGAALGSPRARPLFRRAILQSGAAHNVSSPEAGARIAERFARELGSSGADLAALRTAPVEQVLDAQQRVVDASWREIEGLAFQPVADGQLIPGPPLEAVVRGEARHVDVLVGTNHDEWRLYGLTDAKARSLDEAGLLRRLVRNPPGASEDPEPLARRAIEVYRRARLGRLPTEPRELWFALQTDRVFRVPAIRLAEAQSRHQQRTWAYLFTWASPALDGALGACHGVEVPFVFGTLHHAGAARLVGSNAEAERLSRRIQDAWLSFASGRDPGWPAYEEGSRITMVLGRECQVVRAPGEAERRFWSEFL